MDMKQIINTITNFLSNKINLTLIQCILYCVLGWMLGDYLTWGQFGIVFIIILLINLIVHVKGVSHGMFMFQVMRENEHDYIKFIKKMEKDVNNSDTMN